MSHEGRERSPRERLAGLFSAPKSRNREMAIGAALREWGQTDPQGAMAYIAGLDRISKRRAAELVNYALAGWAAADAEQAWDWAIKSCSVPPEGVNKRDFLVKRMDVVLEEMCESGKASTAANLISGGDPSTSLALVQILAAKWAERDMSATVRWAGDLDNSIKFAAMSAVAIGVGRDQPDLAIPFIEAISDPGVREAALTGVVSGFVDVGDRQGAVSLIQNAIKQQPPELLQGAMMAYCNSTVPSEWDVERELITKVATLTSSSMVVQNFIKKTQDADPAQAISMVADKYPAEKQMQALGKIYRNWAGVNAAAAEADLLKRGSISSADQATLLAAIRAGVKR